MDKDLLKKKERLIDDAIVTLKKEFVGIDEQIDGIMDNLRTWFLFPELQDRPLVISVWGLTGTGKTSLIKRIAQLLDIERDLVYFNFAEIGECSSWEIESRIEEELSNERSNRFFVYDEFQYANTLDKHGEEKDKRSGLKPFWELMDTGKIHKRDSFYQIRLLYTMALYLTKINDIYPMKIENGKWVNADECLEPFSSYEIMKFGQYFNFNLEGKNQPNSDDDDDDEDERDVRDLDAGIPKMGSKVGYDFFIKESYAEKLIDIQEKSGDGIRDRLSAFNELRKMSCDDIIELIGTVYENASKGYDLNFSDSVIFVVGNLDEAYEMALNVDPDMSPDQFHKLTKKITVVDVKKALQERFRNEQIARLGNIHLIYPSFSSESFRKLIDMCLDKYARDVHEMTGYVCRFSQSVKNIIYKESVFPTHGTRPIFSTVHEIVKTKLPFIVRCIYEGKYDAKYIDFKYSNKNTVVSVYDNDNNLLFVRKYKEKLRLEKLRDNTKDEEQALVAVHESGHFVMYAKLYGEMPEKLCSKTASSDSGGFMLKDSNQVDKIHSYNDLLNAIKISLGGYVAEQLVFGDEKKTSGASEDLRNATLIASRMVRSYGMGVNVIASTYYTDPDVCLCGNIIKEDDQKYINDNIKEIFNMCLKEVVDTLSDTEWRKMLKESAKYLSTHSAMPKKKMEECYALVSDSVKKSDKDDSYYRGKIEEI